MLSFESLIMQLVSGIFCFILLYLRLKQVVWLARLVECWFSAAVSWAWSLVSAYKMVVVVMLDRLAFSWISDTYLGFLYQYRPHISTKDGGYRQHPSASCVYCIGGYASTVCMHVCQNTCWKANNIFNQGV